MRAARPLHRPGAQLGGIRQRPSSLPLRQPSPSTGLLFALCVPVIRAKHQWKELNMVSLSLSPKPVLTQQSGITIVRDDFLPGGTKQRACGPFLESVTKLGGRHFICASPFAGFAFGCGLRWSLIFLEACQLLGHGRRHAFCRREVRSRWSYGVRTNPHVDKHRRTNLTGMIHEPEGDWIIASRALRWSLRKTIQKSMSGGLEIVLINQRACFLPGPVELS